MTVRLTWKKAENIVQQCKAILGKNIISIREFAQLIGKFVAAEPGVHYAPLFYKPLEIQRDHELKINKGNFDSSMALSFESIDCIQWWIDNLHKAFKPILISKPDRIIESDSSLTGYGAHDVTYNQEFSGLWTGEDQQHHINFLELKAAFLSLKHLCGNVTNEHIQLFLDNMTAIKYLSKMGGRKERLNALTKEIWLWCMYRNIYISAFHIPGVLNTRADNLSRQKLNLDMEWTLRKDVFVRIMDLYGPSDIDLFASSDNHQLPQYVSYLPDPKAVAVNAFSLSWTNLFPFIFCPFSVINSVLQKLEQDQAEAVMVAPLFTTQPWFPRLLQQVLC